MRLYQLRIYEIKPGLLAEWVDRWLTDIVPARREHGFDVLGAWTIESSDEFIWLVAAGDSRRTFDDCEADYRASRTAAAAGVGQDMNPMDYLAANPDVRVVIPVPMDNARQVLISPPARKAD